METEEPAEPPPIRSRTDTGGAWSAAGPLLALALIGLMLVQSCLPPSATTPGAPPAASRQR
jgi:hypothetical protein